MKYLQNFLMTIAQIITLGFLNHFVVLSDAIAQTAPAKQAVANEGATKGLLFEVKSGQNVAYLFGSIHIAKADYYPMSKKVEDAYNGADTVAVEADTSDPSSMQALMPKLSYAAPDKLQNHLKPETWSSIQAVFGPAAEQMQGFKPFVLSSAVSLQVGMQMGFDPSQGIDLHYINRTKKDKKSLIELEGAEYQINLVSSLNDQEGDAMIASLLSSMKTGELPQELTKISNAWKAGDAETIAQLFAEAAKKDEGSRKMMKLLMDDRNVLMAKKVSDLMASGKKLFVVVGAGHLAGEKSVVELLQKQGMTVTRIR